MAECKSTKNTGKVVGVEFHIGCGDVLPLETDWKSVSAMRAKEFTLEWETADATADDSLSSLRENLATFQSLSISGDGTVKFTGQDAQNLVELIKHVANPVATGGQPAAWIRMTFPDLTFIAFMLVTNLSRSAPYDDVITYSFEASATASDFGLIVEDTPNPDAPEATSVEAIPATLTLNAGDSYNAEAAVLPVGASQNVRWTSSAPTVAKVDPVSGIITALAAGSATITAAAAEVTGVTDTIAVTVLPIVMGILVSPTAASVEVGDTQALDASVVPAGAAPGLTYTSANTAIATVDGSGTITGVAVGTTDVTIRSAARPSVKTVVPVTVTAAA